MSKNKQVGVNAGYQPLSNREMEEINRMGNEIQSFNFTPNNRKARRAKKNKKIKTIH